MSTIDWTGKIAIVTGAGKGIGLQVARELARKGCHVILTARSEQTLESGLAAASADGEVEGRLLDVADQNSVDDFFEWLAAEGKTPAILVNNAALDPGWKVDVLETSADYAAEIFNNNTLSAWRTIQKTLPLMNAAGFGRIVNVSSEAAILTSMGTGNPAYRMSKVAMNAITRIAAAESLGDVKVNSIHPGWVRTDMGGPNAHLSVEEGASGVVWAAMLDEDGPNGGFFQDGKPLDW